MTYYSSSTIQDIFTFDELSNSAKRHAIKTLETKFRTEREVREALLGMRFDVWGFVIEM